MDDLHRTIVSNVLIIGSGAAGLRAAIAAHQAGVEVRVIGKSMRRDAHTVLASGGINAVLGNVDPGDRYEHHFADTIKEAYFLANPRMVEIMVKEAPAAVLELDEWGCQFSRTAEGKLDQRYFGAHKFRRTCYAGDYTGREVLRTLDEKAAELEIPVLENQYVSRLLVEDGLCFGALGFDISSGQRTVFLADAVILAGGGHTRIWRRSSSRRDENTGSGMYLALQAGCALADMEFVQFHPTGMVAPEEWAGSLVTEAVRGEGGVLRNKDGERFMQRYDPERMELSTRDRVALAIYTEIMEGRGGPNSGVFLDISHHDKSYILEKLPRMYRQMLEAQMLDIAKEPMEVAPTAHYSMGGVVVDPETTATSLGGLFAAGEVTAGLHGANRLGGNSLAETLVFGRRAGESAAAHSRSLRSQVRSPQAIQAAHEDLEGLVQEGDELARPLQRALRDSMWENCGVLRDKVRLQKGLEKVDDLKTRSRSVDVRPTSEGFLDLATALDLRASLALAEATLLLALERQESRGAHQRSDFTETDPSLLVNFSARRNEKGQLRVASKPVPPIPAGLQEWVDGDDEEYPVEGRLLE
jgi:succinate dehydrogenase / fumarate reductase, flavoprotein subunit